MHTQVNILSAKHQPTYNSYTELSSITSEENDIRSHRNRNKCILQIRDNIYSPFPPTSLINPYGYHLKHDSILFAENSRTNPSISKLTQSLINTRLQHWSDLVFLLSGVSVCNCAHVLRLRELNQSTPRVSPPERSPPRSSQPCRKQSREGGPARLREGRTWGIVTGQNKGHSVER